MRSYDVDYNKLDPGIYKKSVSGFVTTWDIRVKTPNKGDYLSPEVIHTIEHTMSQYLRGLYGNYRIVGVFPIASQTGFYVVTRFIGMEEIYAAIVNYALNLQRGYSIPSVDSRFCGNKSLHDLTGAKRAMLLYYENYLKYMHSADYYNE